MCEPLEENLEDIDLDNVKAFKYLACLEVEDSKDMPQGMTYWEIPKRKYLVFTHIGSPESLGETYKAIYSNGYQKVVMKLCMPMTLSSTMKILNRRQKIQKCISIFPSNKPCNPYWVFSLGIDSLSLIYNEAKVRR